MAETSVLIFLGEDVTIWGDMDSDDKELEQSECEDMGYRLECEIVQIIVSYFGEKGDFVAGCAGYLHFAHWRVEK